MVYTLMQVNSPWKGENCLKRITLLGSERKSVSTFLSLFFEREGQWDIFTWFGLLKLVTKLAPVLSDVKRGTTAFPAYSYDEKKHWVKVDGLKNFGA